jgi:PIN domain nuclease of toxin-antitoxin system
MKVLLDTHVLLWALADSDLLSPKARRIIADEGNECLFSPVSLVEIAIKHRKHPKDMPLSAEDTRAALLASGYRELPFSATDALPMDGLEPHHSDPFDRMLIAQAMAESCTLLSHDDAVAKYGDSVMYV